MRRYILRLKLRGAHVVQPPATVRKLDHGIAWYKCIVDGNIHYSPIPPESFRGALRHVAYIAANRMGLEMAYNRLFGSDIRKKDHFLDTPETKEGKLSIRLVKGLTKEERERLVEERTRIKVHRAYGVVEKEALAVSEVISSDLCLEFEVSVEDSDSEDEIKEEERLLNAAFNLLKGWGVGGWVSLGLGLVEDLEVLKR